MTPHDNTPDAHDLAQRARTALACLDLTSLNNADTEADIAALCQRAHSRFGAVAAVCVWPRLAAFARSQLPAHIGVAAVANFPHGNADVAAAVQDTLHIVQAGAQEVDVVLPYRALMAGDEASVTQLLCAVRQACPGLILKVILETGALHNIRLIERASVLALEAGADFLKTSTGKTRIHATVEAATTMLDVIASRASNAGFKASGGIRTLKDAIVFASLTAHILGDAALNPRRFRIGASSLLGDIEAVLGGASAVTAPAGSY